jgi:hypothetical protein
VPAFPQVGRAPQVPFRQGVGEALEVAAVGGESVEFGGLAEDDRLSDAVDLRLLTQGLAGGLLEGGGRQFTPHTAGVDQRVVDVPQNQLRHGALPNSPASQDHNRSPDRVRSVHAAVCRPLR